MVSWARRKRYGAKSRLIGVAGSVHAKPRQDMTRLGSEYGGWWIPAAEFNQDSIVYSAGVGEDATFDIEMIDRFGCSVHAFDPTPRAIRFASDLEKEGFVMHPWALWHSDESIRLFFPALSDRVSLSISDRGRTGRSIEVEARCLESIARDLGHGRVDLLKLDIEGAEAYVIDALLVGSLTPRVLAVEFEADEPMGKTLRRVRKLLNRGYSLMKVERRNYVFVQD